MKKSTVFLTVAFAFIASMGLGAVSRVATLPPYDPTADVGKVPVIGATGYLSWSTASAVSGAVVGATGVTNNLVAFSSGTGKAVKDSGIPLANVVLTSRAVQAGTGLTVTNSGLLSSDITMSLTAPVSIANGGTAATGATAAYTNLSPLTTKGDLVGFSTLPIRVAIGSTGQLLQADSTAASGLSWTTNILGTTSNNSAPTGYVGEFKSASVTIAAAVTLTTATAANVTSIALTPGDWDIGGYVTLNGTITGTLFYGGITNSSATLPGEGFRVETPTMSNAVANVQMALPTVRYNTNTSDTVYLVARCTFTVGTAKAAGSLFARRVR